MSHYKNIADLGALDGKRVLIRADLNVPMGKNTTLATVALDPRADDISTSPENERE